MKIELKKIDIEKISNENIQDVCDFFNFHRKLTNAPKEMWETFEEAEETLKYWINNGEFQIILFNNKTVGFIYYKYLNKTFVRLEDIYVQENFRNKGVGRLAIELLDKTLKEQGVLACSVNVIPRNSRAIEFYISCGFDHLNMIEIRKNYEKSFDKDEEVDILGFKLKKY